MYICYPDFLESYLKPLLIWDKDMRALKGSLTGEQERCDKSFCFILLQGRRH